MSSLRHGVEHKTTIFLWTDVKKSNILLLKSLSLPSASLALCHARHDVEWLFGINFIRIDFSLVFQGGKRRKWSKKKHHWPWQPFQLLSRECKAGAVNAKCLGVSLFEHDFYAPLMIVFLSLPSSLSCTQASTLSRNYLYLLDSSFIYTNLGAPSSEALSMMMFFI